MNLSNVIKQSLLVCIPIAIVYCLYMPFYDVACTWVGYKEAEWISSGSLLMLMGFLFLCFQFKLLPISLILSTNVAIGLCGAISSYYYLLTLKKAWLQYDVLSHFLTWLSTQNSIKVVILYFGPLALSVYLIVHIVQGLAPFRWSFKFGGGRQTSNVYGNAAFATCNEIMKINHKDGIVVGMLPRTGSKKTPEAQIKQIKNKCSSNNPICIKTEHSIMIAPSGAGKNVGVVIPTLLDYPGSVVVMDFKGENYAVTARHRREMGKKVYAFDPFNILEDEGCHINILDALNSESESIIEDTLTICQLLCPAPQKEIGNAKFFKENASALIQCLLLHVICSGQYKKEKINLFKVYDLLCQKMEVQQEFFTEIGGSDYGYGTAARIANSIISRAPEELSGYFSTAVTEMRFLDEPRLKNFMLKSTIDFNEIVQGKADLFICIPASYIDDNPRVARLLFGMIFKLMERAMGQVPKESLLFVMDEMPALGYLPFVDKALNHGRGFGVSLLGISVTIERLKATYPDSWGTFLSSALSIFGGFSEKEAINYVFDRLGTRTVKVNSTNKGSSSQRRGVQLTGSSGSQAGETESETGRPLLNKNEISELGTNAIIAFPRGQKPILCHRATYYQNKCWSGLWDENQLEARNKPNTLLS